MDFRIRRKGLINQFTQMDEATRERCTSYESKGR